MPSTKAMNENKIEHGLREVCLEEGSNRDSVVLEVVMVMVSMKMVGLSRRERRRRKRKKKFRQEDQREDLKVLLVQKFH